MSKPAFAGGVVEQVIFTWSEFNRGGVKGLGFGSVSPGLTAHMPWLAQWPTENFSLMAPGVSRDGTFSSWKSADTCGVFGVDDCNVVFRKMPDGGLDGKGRPRFVVHALVGKREVIDFARIQASSELWLSPADCPLDALPSLKQLTAPALVPRKLPVDDAELIAFAQKLAAAPREAQGKTLLSHCDPKSADALSDYVLALVPTPLWPDLELTFFLDRTGLTLTLDVVPRGKGPQRAEIARIASPEIGTSALHAEVDRRWNAAPGRDWHEYIPTGIRPSGEHRATIDASRVEPPTLDSGAPPQRAIRDALRMVTLRGNWEFDSYLDDAELVKFLELADAGPLIKSWIRDAESEDLRAVFSGCSQRRTFARIEKVMSDAGIGQTALASAWRRSASAPLAVAILRTTTSRLAGSWALPRVDPAIATDDLTRLSGHLNTSERGQQGFFALLEGGLLADRAWRRALLDSMFEAGVRPDFIFNKLLLNVSSNPRTHYEIIHDHIDAFGAWLKMPDEYRRALELGLDRPGLIARLKERTPF